MELGIKALSLENWMDPDPLMRDLVMPNDDGTISYMEGKDWAFSILNLKITETIPIEIRKLYEIARGSMLYGYFFYPLYTLAEEQLYRVAEAAVTEKCNQIAAAESLKKIKTKTFEDKLGFLHDNDVITKQEHEQWTDIRKLRNIASHPEQQTIITPGMALDTLDQLVYKINCLFGIP